MIATKSWRMPVPRLIVNGICVAGTESVEVVTNNHFRAATFNARLALDAAGPYSPAFWAGTSDILIEVLVSLDGLSFVSLLTGRVDTVAIDPVRRILRISGRDLSAGLIEAKSQGMYSNQTSSDIAIALAEHHGLIPNVTSTNTLIGRYYQSEHSQTNLNQFSWSTTDWDLLAFLARQEGFALSVVGTTLNFGPAALRATSPYPVCLEDCININLERSLTLAQDLRVTVKSWNSSQKSAFVQTVCGTTESNATSGGSSPSQQYLYIHPNLTPDQALKFAQDKLAELSLHERVVELLLPGDLSLLSSTTLALSGTYTEFDQVYYIDSVETRLSAKSGFAQYVRARNTSPRIPAQI